MRGEGSVLDNIQGKLAKRGDGGARSKAQGLTSRRMRCVERKWMEWSERVKLRVDL